MQEFRDKRMMGHAFRRCGFKIKVKWKGIGKKKRQFSGLLFFLSILEAASSTVEAVGPGRSQCSVFVLKYILVYNLDRITFS